MVPNFKECMERLFIGICTLAFAIGLLGLTGCAAFNPEGFGMKVQADMYAIQDREATETITTKKRPMICYFRNCDAAGNVIQGS